MSNQTKFTMPVALIIAGAVLLAAASLIYFSLNPRVGAFASEIVWLFDWLDAHNGVVAALAGVAVAAFTFTLWRSTEKLWAVSHRQQLDSKHATYASQVMARAAMRQGRVAQKTLEISVRPVVSATSVALREAPQPRAITFDLVNSGNGPATLKGVQTHGTIGMDERLLFSFGSLSAFQSGDEGVTIEAGNEPLGPIEVISPRLDDDATIHSLMVSNKLQLSIRIIVEAEDILGNSTRHLNAFNWDHMPRGFVPATGLARRQNR